METSEVKIVHQKEEKVISSFKHRFSDAPWYNWMKNRDVLVLGVGGIGSWVAMCLARIGCTVHIYDMDTVESSNLGGQLYSIHHVGITKVEATKILCDEFSGKEANIVSNGKYLSSSPTNPIVISAFDNMAGRKLAFEKWAEAMQEDNENASEYIFIDGRLLAEEYQVYGVVKGRLDAYKKTIFNDSEVAEASCSFKATTHCSMSIASDIIAILTNFATNRAYKDDIFNVKTTLDEAVIQGRGTIGPTPIASSGFIKWTNREYTPMYNFSAFKTLLGSSINNILSNVIQRNGEIRCTSGNNGILARKLSDMDLKNHAIFIKANSLNLFNNTALALSKNAEESIDQYLACNSSYTSKNVYINERVIVRHKLSKSLVTAMKTGIPVLSKIKSKVHETTDELYSPVYFANFYFLAMRNHNSNGQAINIPTWPSESEQDFKPLLVLVTKNENTNLIYQASIFGGAIDPSLVELWVDTSLESAEVAHPIRTQYVRSIRNPLIKAGVKLVVKNLEDDFKIMKPPTFKTLSKEKEWISNTLEKMLDKLASQFNTKRPVTEEPGVRQMTTPGGLVLDELPF